MVDIADLREPVLCFNKFDMHAVMDGQRSEVEKSIRALNADVLLSTPVEDVVAQVMDKHRLDVPVLLRHQAQLEEPRESTIPVRDFDRLIHQHGTVLTLVVPFTGDPQMFGVRPTNFDSAPPRGNLDGNDLVLCVRGVNMNKDAVAKAFNSVLDDFDRYLGWQRGTANTFNDDLSVVYPVSAVALMKKGMKPETPEEARRLLEAGAGHRCHMGDLMHLQVERVED
jgi:hypothetical protein